MQLHRLLAVSQVFDSSQSLADASWHAKGPKMKDWKRFEKEVARALGGQRIINARFSHPDRIWFVSAPDVGVRGHPELKIDCKCSTRFSHHRLMREVQNKYCDLRRDEPVLITKEHGDTEAVVSIRLEFFAWLLESDRRLKKFFSIFPSRRDYLPERARSKRRAFLLTLSQIRKPPDPLRSVPRSRRAGNIGHSQMAPSQLQRESSDRHARPKMPERPVLRLHALSALARSTVMRTIRGRER